jgi:hypothetical protein
MNQRFRSVAKRRMRRFGRRSALDGPRLVV